ncbi:MAG: NADH:flavin oxidoreductase/NADH oxidase [Bacteroidota bacterium]
MPRLFDPITFKQVTARNRMMVSPMCQYSSVNGFANDWHLVHLGSRAVGGAGIVMTEATAVSPEGRISPNDLGIWDDEHISFLSRITEFIHQQGAVAAIQLAHAGRKASTAVPWKGRGDVTAEDGGWKPVAPSPIPWDTDHQIPEALRESGIRTVVNQFKDAALRAQKAGFRILEIHASHGYLIHEFLSPITNKRSDWYGGSFENRTRFLMEIIEGIRTTWPEELPIFVRISATDWIESEHSWNVDQSVALSKMLKSAGVDLIDVSSGGIDPKQRINVHAGYQVPFSERIKKEAEIATGAVGLITEGMQAETILSSGQSDLIIMARELLRNPYFPLLEAPTVRQHIDWPVQYERSKPR